MKRLKVALICHVSNKNIREHLSLSTYFIKNSVRRLLRRPLLRYSDYGVWNTLLFNEFNKFEDVELHAIIPHPGMKKLMQSFNIDGVFYHCFNQQRSRFDKSFRKNRLCIKRYVEQIEPDIINIIGLEAPYYSLSALDIDTNKYPLIVSMQTALSDPDFVNNYPMNRSEYNFKVNIEQEIFQNVKYIASGVSWYRTIVSWYNPNAFFLTCYYCTNSFIPPVSIKEYDFAYWAADISKAGEDAIKAFIVASKKQKGITMNVVGKYSQSFYQYLFSMLAKEGLENQVTFSGYFPTHYDALCQVAKSRFALVPIKIDILSTTIREAILMSMPVVTYETKGTPSLNRDKPSILISKLNDYDDLGNNMVKLMKNEALQVTLAENALAIAKKDWDNEKCMRIQADMYRAVYEHFHKGNPIPKLYTDPLC